MTLHRMTLQLVTVTSALLLVASGLSAQRGGPPPLVSPEISDDGGVTFRLRAADADGVSLTAPGDIPAVPFGGGLDMVRNAEGVWEVTLENVDSGAYRYSFNVDGVTTLDPSNPLTSQRDGDSISLFYVSGQDFMDTQAVPHGAVAEVTYFSEALQHHRRMHVYTPPGYQTNGNDYPAFYLLHGAGDSDDSWSTAGRAGFILDNLLAAGDAEPMVVVMPHGHTTGEAEFPAEFVTDIKPYIEDNYRVRTDRGSTALAGLSMGGAQTLEIGVSNLDEYAYLGVFSSGVFGIGDDTSYQDTHEEALNDSSLKDGLELFWFSTGRDDFLLETTEQTVAMLGDHGFDVVYEESSGGHTWINWREYLNVFVPKLFQ
jgi:enterochelin esterase-like enzyme